ncbi:YdcH family protein [Shewanella phaeophyticola]|jgi:uncharacterized protein YdcH (DUF465 family)|uniref:YdcH family protein n=1 Tax=Shewanella phaeophyticola TaxID=2978345 RepID=A0ABT2P451_9GAMM|nr:YdcH family protein [Shewanella sp. KJ10-1]MCT8986170.1 YdcH family protein [Shewanella sp. KJ10-1]MCU7375696.1 YdcH family protein [Paucibacter sp. O1-1]MDA3830704.1 YdcH family protein [Paucibacter sp. O1-1]
MLGENHCLILDFPEFTQRITELNAADSQFAADANQYHELDLEIRTLELDGAPINDEDMHQLKHRRSLLKDSLYQRITNAVKR